MDRSFLSYYLNRSQNFAELAAPAIPSLKGAKDVGEKQHEIRKIPIYMDNDDIAYLEQFPPSFWPQALARRYGKNLMSTADTLNKKKEFKDVEHVTLKYSGGEVTFKNIHTGANKLHDKLTRDVDDLLLSKLQKTPEHREQYASTGAGHYGFDLSNIRRSKEHPELMISEGFIGLTVDQARKLLAEWRQGARDGWLGKMPRYAKKRTVRFGGGTGHEDTPVYSTQALQKHSYHHQEGGKRRFHAIEQGEHKGKAQWVGYKTADGETIKVAFNEYLPVLLPGTKVNAGAVKKFNQLKKMGKKMSAQSDEISQMLAENPMLSVEDAIKKITGKEYKDYLAVIDPNERKRQFFMNELEKEHQAIREKLTREGPAREGQQVTIKGQKELKDRMEDIEHIKEVAEQLAGQEVTRENLPAVLKWVSDQIHRRASAVRNFASRYDVHDWNIHRHSTSRVDPNDPESSLKYSRGELHRTKGFGTHHVNWQQREQVHSTLLQRGVDPEKLRDELMPHLVEAGRSPVGRDPSGPHIPYTVRRREDVRKGHRQKSVIDEDKVRSPLAQGINSFLRKPSVFGDTPTFIALKNNWWNIFDNATDYLWAKIGSREVNDYLEAKEKGDSTAIEAAMRNLEIWAKNQGANYTKMIHQVLSRSGKESLDVPTRGGQPVGETLAHEENKIHDDAYKFATYNRTRRPAEVGGGFGPTGHGISVLQSQIDKEAQALAEKEGKEAMAAVASPPEGTESREESNMMKTLTDDKISFLTYRNYYIWDKVLRKREKIKAGTETTEEDEWNLEDANSYANQMMLKKNPTRQYGGDLRVRSTGIMKVSQLHSAKEMEIKAKEKDMQKRIEREEILSTASGIKTGEDPAVKAIRKILDGIRDPSKSPEDKKEMLDRMSAYAQGMRGDDPNYEKVHEIINAVAKNLGVKLPGVQMFGRTDTAALQKIVNLARNPSFHKRISPSSPYYVAGYRQKFESILKHYPVSKYPQLRIVQDALDRTAG